MLNIIMRLIMMILILFGITLIYDARIITKKFFGFGDQNEAALGFKMIGFIISIVGALIFFFNK